MKASTMKLASEGEWLDAIAASTKLERAIVEEVLRRHGVTAQATAPRARRVSFTSLRFSGTKEEASGNSDFAFEWDELGPGLWAVMSDFNGRGKSSVLNILQCALRGDFPHDIKPDVWRWISKLSVGLRIDQVDYEMLVDKSSGVQDAVEAVARLLRKSEDEWISLYEGDLPGLKGHTEGLFMHELGFTKIHAVNDAGTQYEHSWPAIASALAIGGNSESKALFGDQTMDALHLRLLQLFIGLPWISTLTAILTAKKILAPAPTKSVDPLAAVRARLSAVDIELAAMRKKSSSFAERADLRRRMSILDADLVSKQGDLAMARGEVRDLEQQVDMTRTARVAQARLVQELKDERDAGYVFRNLRPERCPACEADFHAHPVVHDEDNCPLCKLALVQEKGGEDDRLAEAEANLADIVSAFQIVDAKLKAARKSVTTLEAERDAIARNLGNAQTGLRGKSEDVELRIAELDATARELRALLGGADEPVETTTTPDKAVLDAAEKQTRNLIEGLQAEILKDVAEAIMRLSTRFGVRNLTRSALNGAGALKLVQGGADTSFSKLTKGERLRMKIAAALAAVEVARSRGLGRHPGLLLLDSPGAEEVVDTDFHEMLANVSRVATEMGGVQVFIGTIYRGELEDVVPFDNRRHAKGTASLF